MIEHVVDEGFNEFFMEDIFTEWKLLPNKLVEHEKLPQGWHKISLEESLQERSWYIAEGAIARTLSHIKLENQRSKSIFEQLAYKFSENHRRLVYIYADMDVIKRGMGVELQAYLQYAKNMNYLDSEYPGLSLREIDQFLSQGITEN